MGAALPAVERSLHSLGLEYDVRTTQAPGDASRFAREALADRRRFLVAVGGDGTVHEVVNGMLDEDGAVASEAVLGVVAAGSGCDLVRTFGLPSSPEGAAARLAGGDVRALDVVKISHVDTQGRHALRYFANIAEAGLGAATARRAATLPRSLGAGRYLLGFWATLPSYEPGAMRIEMDDTVAYEGRAVNVVAANCRFFGGGMQISPRSDPGDGLVEVLVFTGRKTDSFTLLPRIYRGRHLPNASIVELRGSRLRLHSDQPVEIEADGEVLGTTPATVEVLPGAINLKV